MPTDPTPPAEKPDVGEKTYRTKLEFAPRGMWYDREGDLWSVFLTDDDNAPFTRWSRAAVKLLLDANGLRELSAVVAESLAISEGREP